MTCLQGEAADRIFLSPNHYKRSVICAARLRRIWQLTKKAFGRAILLGAVLD
jgi:hypothetical protein